MAFDWVIAGGFLCGVLAGAAARYGRLCTMSAIEDALVGRDLRGAKAWGVAIVVAIVATQALVVVGVVDLAMSIYRAPQWHLLGTVLGGLVFGLGMTLVGTCSFGLLVRAGGGDLRSAISAMIVGIVAIAMTAGILAPLREPMLSIGRVDLSGHGGMSLDAVLGRYVGKPVAVAVLAAVMIAILFSALIDARLRQRRRLLTGAVVMGLTIALAWAITTWAVDEFRMDRVESLSFVAPVGRGLAQFMMDAFRQAGFGVATATGVVVASLAVALVRDEFRWEAFDDPIEMRRHLAGGALMGMGGVLAQGCTIGQGLSAASTLSISAPVFVASLLVGARLGLLHLIEGRSLWRLGRS